MPDRLATVFFTFTLVDSAAAPEVEGPLLANAGAVLADATVQRWTLHRATAWAGESPAHPDFVLAVEVTDVEQWADREAAALMQVRGTLEPDLRASTMVVTAPVSTKGAP